MGNPSDHIVIRKITNENIIYLTAQGNQDGMTSVQLHFLPEQTDILLDDLRVVLQTRLDFGRIHFLIFLDDVCSAAAPQRCVHESVAKLVVLLMGGDAVKIEPWPVQRQIPVMFS